MGKNETIISLSQDYCDIPKNASKIDSSCRQGNCLHEVFGSVVAVFVTYATVD